MTEKMQQNAGAGTDDGQSNLKKALIVFAIVEALVLILIALYMIFR